MSSAAKALEPAFQRAVQRVGTEIWRIENFQPVPLPKSDYGKFCSGDSYIILQTSSGEGGAYLYDIRFWLGKDTGQDEAGTAAIKTVELDAVLGGRTVQYRELQGHESDKFLLYFKPCIIPLEGGVISGFKKPEEKEFETRLYICRGKRAVRLKQVPFSRSSLNHDDVSILDTKDKIYQFNGENSNIQERAKALEVIQFLKDKYHEGKCDVAIVDDGKLQAESDSGEFWVLCGGYAPLGKSINDGQVKSMDELSKSLLENNKCYLLDCGAEIFVWVGRVTHVEERKAAIQAAEEDKNMASILATKMYNSLKARPVQGQIFQGKEPPQFVAIFQPMVVLKGGMSAGYKNYVADKGLNDETYTGDCVALIKISGTSVHNIKAVQVEAVATSLNSAECFLLQSGSSIFIWNGNESTFEQQELAAKVAEFLKPRSSIKQTKEGTESSAFWFAVGGKQSYTSKKVSPNVKYVDMASSLEGLCPNVPLYKVTEGNEASFFTTYFSWDPIKASAHGNSFQKKVMFLFGGGHSMEGGPTQRASALAALNSAFTSSSGPKPTSGVRPGAPSQGSQRAAAVAALSSVLTAEKKRSPETSPARPGRSPPAEVSNPASAESENSSEVEASKEVEAKETEAFAPVSETSREDLGSKPETDQDENCGDSGQSTFSYEQLKAKSDNPVTGIDFKRREAYLSDE